MNIIPIPESMTKKSGRIKMKKRVLVALLATALTVSMMTGCGSKKTEDTSSTKTEETSEDSDQEAADKVAKLIDDIYVQERTDKTDEQCKAAKEAWDKLTDAQKELVEGENADPDYFGRDTGDASKDDPLNEDNIGENEILVVSFGTSFNDSRAEDLQHRSSSTMYRPVMMRRSTIWIRHWKEQLTTGLRIWSYSRHI